jgi:hypothetical protein
MALFVVQQMVHHVFFSTMGNAIDGEEDSIGPDTSLRAEVRRREAWRRRSLRVRPCKPPADSERITFPRDEAKRD